jgi:DNA-binding transcriptional regulator YiaG
MHSMHTQADPKAVKLAVPNELTRIMRERGVKDVKLAAHLDVDQSTVYRWRMRFSPMDDYTKEIVAAYLGVSIPERMRWSCEPTGAAA